jgi:hypothetical protein
MLFALPVAAVVLLPPRRPGLGRALALAYAIATALAAYPPGISWPQRPGAQGRGVEEEVRGHAPAHRQPGRRGAVALDLLDVAGDDRGAGRCGLRDRAASGSRAAARAASLAPVAVFIAFSFYWYPRYVLFATVPLLVLAARASRAAGGGDRRRASRTRGDLASLARRPDRGRARARRPFRRRAPRRSGESAAAAGWSASSTWTASRRVRVSRGRGLAPRRAGRAAGQRSRWRRRRPGRRTLFLCLRTYFMNEPRARSCGSIRWRRPGARCCWTRARAPDVPGHVVQG